MEIVTSFLFLLKLERVVEDSLTFRPVVVSVLVPPQNHVPQPTVLVFVQSVCVELEDENLEAFSSVDAKVYQLLGLEKQ